ncbi:DUF3892 domain-containing protein [Pseudomonas sp. HS6]|uniref:DUF3892 domain-containing protein n=1 Tax=Pseudomonas sp. HS6 TaxID=2850559 RepID=UPI0020191B15|nr:DUF3892 domain-containing protein [Pseudomonas sp. HS6]UQS17263.1 DUF3892 domain-containing protein [Pseudomonas sp. HS6]
MQFYIKQIKKDSGTGNIVEVAIYGKGEKYRYWVRREFVAQMINQGAAVHTLFERDEKWVLGAKVEVYEESFLRTVANTREEDNLESLPTVKI